MQSSHRRADVLAGHLLAARSNDGLQASLISSAGSVQAEFSYAYSYRGKGDGTFFGDRTSDPVRCTVRSGRGQGHTLEKDGFVLSRLPLERAATKDLYDVQQCFEGLYPLAAEVVRRELPGSTKVFVFDHVTRNARRAQKEIRDGLPRTPMLDQGYVNRVHGDYTARSGFSRAEQLLAPYDSKACIDEALRGRFAFVNIWVPLNQVERDPLGLLQWRSQKPQDVQTIRLHFEHRVGEVYRVLPSTDHRWVYYPAMQPGECLVFKVFDSATDGRARFSLHSAFEDPTSPEDAAPRESIELRAMVFFDELPADFAAGFVPPHLSEGSPDRLDVEPERVEVLAAGDEW